jgi:hypothetical protein
MTDWHGIVRGLLSGDVGSLVVLAGLVAIAIAVSSTKDPKELGKHLVAYAFTLALIVGAYWAGYMLIS